MHDLIRNQRRQRSAMLGRDEMQHHVDRPGAAGAGEQRAILDENIVRHLQLREFLGERGDVLPVYGAATAVQNPAAREQICARADAAEPAAAAMQATQPGEHRAVTKLLRVKPGAGEHEVAGRRLGDAGVGGQQEAVAGALRRAVARDQAPIIQTSAGKSVGDPKRLHRRGERDQRKVWNQIEADDARGHIRISAARRSSPYRRGTRSARPAGASRFLI